jgi:PAP2 superfamily
MTRNEHASFTSAPPTVAHALLALGLLAATLAAGCQTSSSGAGPGSPTSPGTAPGGATGLDGPNAAVIDWSQAAYDAFVAEEKYGNPMRAVRVLAMVHVAQHDALNAIRPIYAPQAYSTRTPDADPVAAAASAAFEVLAAELPGQRDALAARLAQTLKGLPDQAAGTRGVELGQRAAAAILEQRKGDGADTAASSPVTPPTKPGVYGPVAPLEFLAAPGWKDLKPFALQSPQQFRVGPPPALTSDEYTSAFQEVKRVGGKGSTARSAEQTAYGTFWYEFSDIGWNRVARVVATDRKLGLQETARLFALLNMAMSDAYVAGWDSKFHYNFWRPTTAIRQAATDGNPATAADAAWESELVTPPVQDHPSTHSALGDAAAEVLGQVLGDATPFTMPSTSSLTPEATRSFPSFTVAANENADSRVMAGLHFRFACKAGQALGRQVGAWVATTALQPLKNLAARR